jgi:hypothetical protein
MGIRRGFWWGALVLLAGCVVPNSGGEANAAEAAIPAGQGQLVIRWKAEAGRSVLGSSWAAANADVYELALIGAADTKYFDLTTGSGQALAATPGSYRLVVLAGLKRSSGSSTAYLVGSALAESVTVTEGQRTPVDLVLRSVDLSWGTSGPAYWKSPLTVTSAGKSRNPRVGMSLSGASTTLRPRFKSTELWNGYKEVGSVTGTPDDWSADAAGTVPDQAAGLTVGLVGASLQLQDLTGTWVSLAGVAHHSWFWPNRPDLADTHPLAPYTELAVACGPPPTGLQATVGWE